MKQSRMGQSNENGTALVIVILILMALTAIVMGVSSISVNETQIATNEMLDKRAFYLAEAGAEKSIKYLSGLATPFRGTGTLRNNPYLLLNNVSLYNEGTVTTYLDPLDSNNGSPTRFVAVTVRATLNGSGMTKCLQVKVGQQNFSRYAYFSDLEKDPVGGQTIWFVTKDEFFGPLHTNDRMHIYGSPKFHEEASSNAATIDYYNGGPPSDDPEFLGGLTLNASRIPLPTNTSMILNKANESGGLKLTGNPVYIKFLVDAGGNRSLSVSINGGAYNTMAYPSNGVIYVQGLAQVEGKVKGQVTIGSNGDIRIMDNIVYNTDPRIDPNSTDLLGLVSDANVIMWNSTANLDTADETVMAAIMALNTSWTVQSYNSGSPRGKLIVYGGIIQKQRGAVGTFNSSSGAIVTGYEKAYSYDARLMDNPPPAFPTTGQVEKVAWTEVDPSTDISLNVW
jgi:Tfp pilus assembly protein PilX